MSSLVGDLWPADLVKTIPTSPLSIMKEQALRLAGKTGDLVQADVRPRVSGNTVQLSFNLVMPLLENYRYALMSVSHQVDQFFPLSLRLFEATSVEIANQADFVECIRDFLRLLADHHQPSDDAKSFCS